MRPVTARCMFALLTTKRLVLECFSFAAHNAVPRTLPTKLPIRYLKNKTKKKNKTKLKSKNLINHFEYYKVVKVQLTSSSTLVTGTFAQVVLLVVIL